MTEKQSTLLHRMKRTSTRATPSSGANVSQTHTQTCTHLCLCARITTATGGRHPQGTHNKAHTHPALPLDVSELEVLRALPLVGLRSRQRVDLLLLVVEDHLRAPGRGHTTRHDTTRLARTPRVVCQCYAYTQPCVCRMAFCAHADVFSRVRP